MITGSIRLALGTSAESRGCLVLRHMASPLLRRCSYTSGRGPFRCDGQKLKLHRVGADYEPSKLRRKFRPEILKSDDVGIPVYRRGALLWGSLWANRRCNSRDEWGERSCVERIRGVSGAQPHTIQPSSSRSYRRALAGRSRRSSGADLYLFAEPCMVCVQKEPSWVSDRQSYSSRPRAGARRNFPILRNFWL